MESELNSNKNDWSNIFNFSDSIVEIIPFKVNKISYFRKAFWNHVNSILEEQKKISRSNWNTWSDYYDSFQNTSNWETLINPEFSFVDWKLSISAEVGFYESYHAFNWLKNWYWDRNIDFKNEINYKVLSAWVLMYDEKTKSFYLFKRPNDSQEEPWSIDLLWGCMNTKDGVTDWTINPWKYVQSRIKTKSWLNIDSDELEIMWVQEFQERWFYNLVYLYKLNEDEVNTLNAEWRLARISNETIDEDKNQDNPWWSALTLALEYLEKNKE